MKQLSHVWFIALKDLKLFVTDRLALFFFILFPFLFVILFNYLLSGVGQQDERLVLHLVTLEDYGGLSRQVIDSLETKDEAELKPGEAKIVWDKDYGRALRAVEDKKMAGFILFPEDFTKSVLIGYGANLTVVVNPENTAYRAALNGIADAIASAIGLQHATQSAIAGLIAEQQWLNPSGVMSPSGRGGQSPTASSGGSQTQASLIKFGTEKVGEVEAENPSNYVIPGYLVMFVFLAAASAAEMIVRERQNHTLERLLASSVKKGAILGGIFAGNAAKGLIQIIIFWSAGILVFKIDLGVSPAAVFILSILMVLMSSAFALMLATLAKTQRGASSSAVLVSLVLAPLGGCWWPLFITPKWMQFLAKLTPHGWANTGFNKLMVFGAGFSAVTPEMLALAGFAIAFALIAALRFRTSAV
ncbi:MAG: ABC transporter permease [Chloroflexota bacterium]